MAAVVHLRYTVGAGETLQMTKPTAPPETHTKDAKGGAIFVFAPFRLDLRAGQLLRGTQSIALRPKTFAVLRHMVQLAGALVTKEELLDAVWGDVAVSENTLTQSIGELRRALQDDTTPPRFVETVHRRGFRFVAPIQVLGSGSGVLGSEEDRPEANFFVGRGREMQRLEGLLARAERGQRQVVFVAGEAGIGKTTLIQNFLALPAAGHALAMRGQAVEQEGAREPYLPVLDALGRLTRGGDAQRVVALLRRTAPAWLAQMPWLLEPADAAALRQSLTDVRPERMLRELAVFLEQLTATVTLIVVLEDLHWSDPSTIELLRMLAQRSEPARLLVIGTHRPAEASVQDHPLLRAKHTLQLRHQCSEIPLEYLTRADVEAYLAQRFPGGEFPKALAGIILEQTDGNPLFLVAVIEQLISLGWLVATDPGWALAVPLETLHLEVPDDLREMIRFQFQAMSPADRALLEGAGVHDGVFTAHDIALAIDAPLAAAEDICERLARTHRFLCVVDDASGLAERIARQYAFIHGLYRRVIYEEIPAGRRRRLHLAIGAALERGIGEFAAQRTFRLASHFERGGDPVRAITYLAAAAAEAQRRFAPAEAIGCLEAALRLTQHLPDARERRQREIELRLQLTTALNLVYGYASAEVRESCERTRLLCEESGSLPELYEALYALWFSQAMRAERGTTRATTDRLAEVAEQLGHAEPRLRAANASGQIALYEGKYREAADTLRAAIVGWEAMSGASNHSGYGPQPTMAAYANHGLALWILGYPDAARDSYRKALSRAEVAEQPFTLAVAHAHVALAELLRGNANETFRLADRGLALAVEHGFPIWRGLSLAFRGWARVHLGKPAAGVDEMRAAITLFDSSGMKFMRPLLLALLAEGCLRLGRCGDGLIVVEEGFQLMPTTLDRSFEPELWRQKGELLLAESQERNRRARSASDTVRVKQAEQCFQRALEIARDRGGRSLELRAAMSLARLEQRTSARGPAHDRLAAVYGWFTEGFDTQDLQEAKALLGRG